MPLVGLHTTSREGGREEESRSVVAAVTSLACEQVRVKQELEAVIQQNQEVRTISACCLSFEGGVWYTCDRLSQTGHCSWLVSLSYQQQLRYLSVLV